MPKNTAKRWSIHTKIIGNFPKLAIIQKIKQQMFFISKCQNAISQQHNENRKGQMFTI